MSEQGTESGKGARILVVDDEEVIHLSLRRMLGRQGHEVDSVYGGPEGLDRLGDASYDLVISDLMMPEMNGIELLEALKERGESVPVLMITGYPSIKTALQALRLGAVDYIAKPFTRIELLGPVSRALRGRDEETVEPALVTPGDADGYKEPEHRLAPGRRYCLRNHSWALYRQDGTILVGIRASFLGNVGAIAAVRVPEEGQLVEQGLAAFHIDTEEAEEHTVFSPLSGQVVEINHGALAAPASVDSATWLVKVIPNRIDAEVALLIEC